VTGAPQKKADTIMKKPSFVQALTAVLLAAGLTLASAGVAGADPDNSNPGTPPAGKTPAQVYAGVGADAFAELTNNVASHYNTDVAGGASDPVLASYDAVNPQTSVAGETITTKPGCSLPRPNGANGGLTTLLNGQKSTVDTNVYCVDFVRASRAKKTDGSEDSLTFYAQSRDAVGYATVGNAYAPTTPLTTAQLKDIFECTVTDWSEVGGQKGAIHVYSQPSSAATYTFFLSAIGSSIANVTAGCGAGGTTASQQNDGRTLKGDPQGIAPYTISKWAAQANAAPSIPDYRGGTVLGLINTAVAPLTTQSLNGVDYQVLNPAFSAANASYSRLFFNAVRTASVPAGLKSIFEPGGYLCAHQDALLVPYGNTPLGTDTGASTYCGKAY
jgi:ABC-type phosphate transport system substrate-binding protein